MQYPPGVGTTATEHPCFEGMPHFPDTGNGKRQWAPAWEQGNTAKPKAVPKMLTDVTVPKMIREGFPSAGCASGYKSFPFSFAKDFFYFSLSHGEDKPPCKGSTAQ